METFVSHTTITKAQQIIDIIAPIPADKFITGRFTEKIDGEDTGNSCFIGHINRAIAGNPDAHFDGFGARDLTRKFLVEKHSLKGIDGAWVNNASNINGYTEPVIKDRVMHMLNDMKEAGY